MQEMDRMMLTILGSRRLSRLVIRFAITAIAASSACAEDCPASMVKQGQFCVSQHASEQATRGNEAGSNNTIVSLQENDAGPVM
jgi:hypothetical protein